MPEACMIHFFDESFGLMIREMPETAFNPLLYFPWIRSKFQHFFIVIGLQNKEVALF